MIGIKACVTAYDREQKSCFNDSNPSIFESQLTVADNTVQGLLITTKY